MNDSKKEYIELYSDNHQDTALFKRELKDYIINLKNSFLTDFKNINFPECSSSFYYDIFDSIKEKDNICFENCHFFFNDITHKGNSIFKDSKVTFKNCIFKSSWNISPDVNYPSIQLKYESCIFKDTLRIGYIDSYIRFKDCSFTNIELENLLFKNNIAFEKSCTLVLLSLGEY